MRRKKINCLLPRAVALVPVLILLFASCGVPGRSYVIHYLSGAEYIDYSLRMEGRVMLYPSGRIMKGSVPPSSLVALKMDILPCTGPVIFRENGSPVLLTLSEPQALLYSQKSTNRVLFSGEVLCGQTGLVRAGKLHADAALPLGSGRTRILLPAGTSVWLTELGILTSIMLESPPGPRYSELRKHPLQPGKRYVISDNNTFIPFHLSLSRTKI